MARKKAKKTKRTPFSKYFIVWILMFSFLTIAYAGHTSTLRVESLASIQKHIYDYVYISHVNISDSSSASNIQYSFI